MTRIVQIAPDIGLTLRMQPVTAAAEPALQEAAAVTAAAEPALQEAAVRWWAGQTFGWGGVGREYDESKTKVLTLTGWGLSEAEWLAVVLGAPPAAEVQWQVRGQDGVWLAAPAEIEYILPAGGASNREVIVSLWLQWYGAAATVHVLKRAAEWDAVDGAEIPIRAVADGVAVGALWVSLVA